MSKILVDTNVLIYAKDTDSVFHQKSIALFESKAELFLTSKNLSEYYAVVTKGESPLLNPSDALRDLVEFESRCVLLHSTERSYSILQDLISQHKPKGLKIHDFEIASIAIAHGVNQIATFNKSDFQSIQEITIIAP